MILNSGGGVVGAAAIVLFYCFCSFNIIDYSHYMLGNLCKRAASRKLFWISFFFSFTLDAASKVRLGSSQLQQTGKSVK